MWLYEFLARLGLRQSYVAKIMLISFLGVHVPLIVLVAYVLVSADVSLMQSLPVLLVVLVATLIGAGVTLTALWMLLAPLRQASTSIHAYLSRRQIVPLPTRYQDEAGQLMADIQEGITRLDAALDSAEGAARRSEDERQGQFEMLSRMSHELRTPLNIIIGFSEVIQSQIMGPLGTDVYGSYAADIRASGLDLLERVNALLELSATKAGAFGGEEERREIDLGEALETVKGLQHFHGERRGVDIRLVPPARPILVRAEPRALKQALLHVVQGVVAGSQSGHYVLIKTAPGAGGTGAELIVTVPQAPFIADDLPRPLEPYFEGAPEGRQERGEILRQTSAQGFSLSVAAAIAVTQKIGLRLANPISGGRTVRMKFS
ncbi:sensor histidine kinase [Radicibacter daui]|uniref:sensor histidine kinase n=1 Tax=Radicibacter daui TaxID=3064829 RepID=UPI004046CCE5